MEVLSEAIQFVKMKEVEETTKYCLSRMSLEDRSQLLNKYLKKIEIIRNLPACAKCKHFSRVEDEEKLNLAEAELIMAELANRKAKEHNLSPKGGSTMWSRSSPRQGPRRELVDADFEEGGA